MYKVARRSFVELMQGSTYTCDQLTYRDCNCVDDCSIFVLDKRNPSQIGSLVGFVTVIAFLIPAVDNNCSHPYNRNRISSTNRKCK